MPGAQVGPTLLVDDAMPTVTELLIESSGDAFATVYSYNLFASTG